LLSVRRDQLTKSEIEGEVFPQKQDVLEALGFGGSQHGDK
jgi:hypothetical protein